MKKFGFTLAEILLSVAIVGVIAAVTLPALNANVSQQTLEKQTLKFYTQFKKAIDLYKAEEGVDSITGIGFTPEDFTKKYFSVLQKCTENDSCYSDQYVSMDGESVSVQDSKTFFKDMETYLLPDGAVFSYETRATDEDPIGIFFDVNDKKGPNKSGHDFWYFNVFYDGSIDDPTLTPEIREEGTDVKKYEDILFEECRKGNNTCFGHFMRNNFKFDYK